MSPFPELNRGALVTADLAYVDTQGAPADRVRAAIGAYLWSIEQAERTGVHPSYNDLREALGLERIPCCSHCGARLPHDEWTSCKQRTRDAKGE